MSNRRDRWIAASVAGLVVLLAGLVVTTVLTAERNGRKALESLQLAQLNQLSRLLDSAFGPAVKSTAGLTNPATGQPWSLAPNDPGDLAGLSILQRSNPTARTGYVLLDDKGVVTNGTLLTSPGIVGKPLTRPGLTDVLAGTPSVLPDAPNSLTTPLPTIAVARPIRGGPTATTGTVRGAILNESDVAPDSLFTQLMASFKRAHTDSYGFLDNNNVVVASTDPSQVGKPADPTLVDQRTGFHRHGPVVTASTLIPSVGWRAVYRQTRSEFEGSITGPLRSALLLLVFIALVGAALTFFALLSRLRAARREQERLATINEAREEFISIVSHELRTPATGQLGFLQTLLDHWDGLNEDERRQTVTAAYANARRLHALTRDVLSTASIEAGELPYAFETVDLEESVRSAVTAMPLNDHTVVVAGAHESVLVRADPERVQQVLTNLLDNAVNNSPRGSAIDISIGVVDGNAKVDVSDRGAGITEDELVRSFEKFMRGRHGTVKGSGLGLYICRKVVEAHGGKIWAERRPGGGATLSFTLPLVAGGSTFGNGAPTGADRPTAPAAH